ncbi:MAG: FMN-binding glutamate synthase family protein [Robiginitomaculum sp.]|nr:MAG: FMN-binding glutamate synthase family protein [Robiginitomaculum sp.]
MRFFIFFAVVSLMFASLMMANVSLYWFIPAIIFGAITVYGVFDLVQSGHALWRNYPVLGRARWLFEFMRPYMQQYLVEGETDGMPFNREQRSLVYRRAKNVQASEPFGSHVDFNEARYEWLNPSLAAQENDASSFRVKIGGPDCKQPYSASVFNISAMSFGSLGSNAISALNRGAAKGGFYHDTGEGAISPYHQLGGDLVWEIGSGYFGCRDEAGNFNPDKFAENANRDCVKMIEIKLSQGAKPGHGGILPGSKVTPEISETRGIPLGETCVSPPSHKAFSTPLELVQFIGQLRKLSGGKPVGFKLCIGHRWEFLAIVKAMLETGIKPDFIVIDGAEGGTGAAPVEFQDHIGSPLRSGLVFVRNALVGAGLRDDIKIGASGKIVSAFGMAAAMAVGADFCNSGRGFMFALGCVQSLSCHTNHCPTGIATQDKLLQRGLVVTDKAERVYHFHHNTIRALAEVVGAAGLSHPSELQPCHLFHRVSATRALPADEVYDLLEDGILLDKPQNTDLAKDWARANSASFAAN